MSDFEFKPFENKEESTRLKEERDSLIKALQKFDIPKSERMFIVKRITYITEKLLEKARYGK